MPADLPRRRDRPVPDDPVLPAEDSVDLIAMEEEIFQAETEELENRERRASELCRAVQRGLIFEDFLDANEIAPGHTIERHVGKEDSHLRERRLPRASTFTDFEAAERAIAQVLRDRSREIDVWLAESPTRDGRFTLDLSWTAGRVKGRDGIISPSSMVRVILMPTVHGYRLKTAYVM